MDWTRIEKGFALRSWTTWQRGLTQIKWANLRKICMGIEFMEMCTRKTEELEGTQRSEETWYQV